MKKIIALMALLGLVNTAFSNEEEMVCPEHICQPGIASSYGYWTIGVGPLPIPAFTVGVGRRNLIGDRSAIDLGLNLATVIRVNALRGYGNVLWYVNQKPTSQYYIGLGASVGGLFGVDHCFYRGASYVAPNILIGKEFCRSSGSKQFFQIESMYPVFPLAERGAVNFAFFNLRYGFAF